MTVRVRKRGLGLLGVAWRDLPPMRLKARFFQRARLLRSVALGAGAAGLRPVRGGVLGCLGARFLFAGAAKIDDFAHVFARDPVLNACGSHPAPGCIRWPGPNLKPVTAL